MVMLRGGRGGGYRGRGEPSAWVRTVGYPRVGYTVLISSTSKLAVRLTSFPFLQYTYKLIFRQSHDLHLHKKNSSSSWRILFRPSKSGSSTSVVHNTST